MSVLIQPAPLGGAKTHKPTLTLRSTDNARTLVNRTVSTQAESNAEHVDKRYRDTNTVLVLTLNPTWSHERHTPMAPAHSR